MAWTPLRTKSFVVKDGEIIDNGGGVGVLFNWWDEIEESEQWQRGIYYALCVSYALVSFITLVCTFYFWELNIISWSLFLFLFFFFLNYLIFILFNIFWTHPENLDCCVFHL